MLVLLLTSLLPCATTLADTGWPLPLIDEAPLRRIDRDQRARVPTWGPNWGPTLAHLWCPTATDYRTKRVSPQVSAKARGETTSLLRQVLRPEFLSPDIQSRLVGLRGWQLGRDFLVAQYARDSAKVQVSVSGYTIGILVLDPAAGRAGGEQRAVAAARRLLVAPLEGTTGIRSGSGAVSGHAFGAIWAPSPRRAPSPWHSMYFVGGPGFVFLAVPRSNLDAAYLSMSRHAGGWSGGRTKLFD